MACWISAEGFSILSMSGSQGRVELFRLDAGALYGGRLRER